MVGLLGAFSSSTAKHRASGTLLAHYGTFSACLPCALVSGRVFALVLQPGEVLPGASAWDWAKLPPCGVREWQLPSFLSQGQFPGNLSKGKWGKVSDM